MNNNHTPLVSVVIPTYNHARYLNRALQSVLDQTYTSWEAIVVDNHSTDNTDEVMASFTDPRISYLKIHNNGVIAASRNMGIRAAKGEWIAFLDSDDWWTEEKITTLSKCFNSQNDVIYHDLEIVGNSTRFFKKNTIRSWQVKSPALMDLLQKGNAIATSSVLIRKELLDKINGMDENPNMVTSEDYNAWLRIAKLTNKFKYIPKTLGFYQLHQQNASLKKMPISGRCAVEDFLQHMGTAQKKKVEARFKYKEGRFNYLSSQRESAKKNFNYVILHGSLRLKIKSILMYIRAAM